MLWVYAAKKAGKWYLAILEAAEWCMVRPSTPPTPAA